MARDNRYILDLEDASFGRTPMLGFPIFMSDTPASLSRTAPRLGQHTVEVLNDVLGYSPAQLGELAAAKVIG
jgi:crotonobetainyl-CoA:carnitine CoA-transferase CaiB-like acyl-CoA transferase